MVACIQNKEPKAHHRLRAQGTRRVGCRWLARLDRGKYAGPCFVERTALQHHVIHRIGWVADEKAQVLYHVGNWRLEPTVRRGDAGVEVEGLRREGRARAEVRSEERRVGNECR